MAGAQAQPSRDRPKPIAVDEQSSRVGLRTVAFFEGLKGTLVLVLLCIVFAVHHHVEHIAASLLYHLHMDPDRHVSESVLDAAERLRYARLWSIAAAAIVYAAIRYIEAWGLWNRRVWAEWFALLSGAMYLPWEAIKLAEHPNYFHVAVIAVNLLIVLYMLAVRVQSTRRGLDGTAATRSAASV